MIPNFFIAPSTNDLSSADVDMVNDADRVLRMRKALTSTEAQACAFDYILIDCPPSLNLLTINAMVAADSVLVPLQCEFFALEGLSQLMLTIREVKQSLNPRLKIQGIVLTMYDRRNNLSGLSEAPSHSVPALIYDHRSSGSIAYQKLAAELLRRMDDNIAA